MLWRKHPLLDVLIEQWPGFLSDPPEHNPFARRDGQGWFHCSALSHKPPTVTFSPRRCIQEYLGLPSDREDWTPESAWKILRGIAVDTAAQVALNRSGLPIRTQVALEDAGLHLRGTPDFMLDIGVGLVGDIKAVDGELWERYYADPAWNPANAYWWRQLQSYLWMTGLPEGWVAVFHGGGPTRQRTLADCWLLRSFQRDEATIRAVERDVRQLNLFLEQLLPFLDDDEELARRLPLDVK